MTAWSREGAIAMERRHITEGEQRIEKQKALIRKLPPEGDRQFALAACALLGEMHAFLQTAKDRLERLEGAHDP